MAAVVGVIDALLGDRRGAQPEAAQAGDGAGAGDDAIGDD
ncbi:Uncharacterised protein [Acinetobacter baumannii]|nr:Uncharacterised protein [Acinetobacter baumannii]